MGTTVEFTLDCICSWFPGIASIILGQQTWISFDGDLHWPLSTMTLKFFWRHNFLRWEICGFGVCYSMKCLVLNTLSSSKSMYQYLFCEVCQKLFCTSPNQKINNILFVNANYDMKTHKCIKDSILFVGFRSFFFFFHACQLCLWAFTFKIQKRNKLPIHAFICLGFNCSP